MFCGMHFTVSPFLCADLVVCKRPSAVHRQLWSLWIKHRDISCGNITIWKDPVAGYVCWRLVDFDLTSLLVTTRHVRGLLCFKPFQFIVRRVLRMCMSTTLNRSSGLRCGLCSAVAMDRWHPIAHF